MCIHISTQMSQDHMNSKTYASIFQRIVTEVWRWEIAGRNSHQLLIWALYVLCIHHMCKSDFWNMLAVILHQEIKHSAHTFIIIKVAKWHQRGPAAPVLLLCPAADLGCQREENLMKPSQYCEGLWSVFQIRGFRMWKDNMDRNWVTTMWELWLAAWSPWQSNQQNGEVWRLD